jgi:hypothetical protein
MSNHLGDTNKMVRDTPRTDSLLTEILDAYGYVHQGNCPQRWVNHARELERELNAANGKIELLMSANADVARIAGERDAAEKRVKQLEAVTNDPHALWANWLRGDVKLPVGIGDVREYQDRIKRLEEAGIKLRECASWVGHSCCQYVDQIRRAKAAIEAWDKEAKL